ncbi:MAG: type II toxin-antitoxin system RelE/ParE family toxin [Chloroflexi bacterium]|nr:type II toxin-antitoxin system RelE/ParE family toxin [Chloroflexota bacterium]
MKPANLVLTRPAQRDVRPLDRTVAKRVLQALERLAETGYGDTLKLQDSSDEWRLRGGDWRIIFGLDGEGETLTGLHILHRSRASRD